MKRIITTAFLLLVFAAPAAEAQRRAEYTNPVAAGDYPDPSVIRVGRDYWATTTTSEWGPHFTLMHSRDLVNWRQVGVVFRRPPRWAVGSFWASEIAEDRGRFYIYYSARQPNGGPLCVAVATAPRPQGPYTDRGPLVCQKVGSIDGFHVRDENGRRYLLWKEDGNSVSAPTPIWAQPLSPDGTRLVGQPQELIRNTESWEKHPTLPYGDLVEGPSIVRRGGWFYMFYSGNFCCGRECNYMVGVARSRRLLGPWEKAPANPIMAGNDDWKCPGHGTVVETADGRHYYLYHAMDAKDFVYVGRQMMLDEIAWGADGWPTINRGRGPSRRAASPHGVRETDAEYRFAEEFTSAALAPGWQWPVGHEPLHSLRPGAGGWLTLAPPQGRADSPLGAVLARPITTGDYVATTLVNAAAQRGGAAGLSAFGDLENALGVSVGGGRVMVWRREKNEQRELAGAAAPRGSRLQLRMTAREGRFYRFAFSADGRAWTDVGEEVDGTYLPPWDRGVRVALVAGGAQGASASFDWLRVVPARR
ncbi:MAG TPA: family 43 glycosylhydrolase [Pyrinomonadaceae bacterium]|nr:family 43 glycosylhydrolase [Pyrinomonadaceae bacterium]